MSQRGSAKETELNDSSAVVAAASSGKGKGGKSSNKKSSKDSGKKSAKKGGKSSKKDKSSKSSKSSKKKDEAKDGDQENGKEEKKDGQGDGKKTRKRKRGDKIRVEGPNYIANAIKLYELPENQEYKRNVTRRFRAAFNHLGQDFYDRMQNCASNMLSLNDTKTLTERQVIAANLMFLPRSIALKANAMIKIALDRYDASREEDKVNKAANE